MGCFHSQVLPKDAAFGQESTRSKPNGTPAGPVSKVPNEQTLKARVVKQGQGSSTQQTFAPENATSEPNGQIDSDAHPAKHLSGASIHLTVAIGITRANSSSRHDRILQGLETDSLLQDRSLRAASRYRQAASATLDAIGSSVKTISVLGVGTSDSTPICFGYSQVNSKAASQAVLSKSIDACAASGEGDHPIRLGPALAYATRQALEVNSTAVLVVLAAEPPHPDPVKINDSSKSNTASTQDYEAADMQPFAATASALAVAAKAGVLVLFVFVGDVDRPAVDMLRQQLPSDRPAANIKVIPSEVVADRSMPGCWNARELARLAHVIKAGFQQAVDTAVELKADLMDDLERDPVLHALQRKSLFSLARADRMPGHRQVRRFDEQNLTQSSSDPAQVEDGKPHERPPHSHSHLSGIREAPEGPSPTDLELGAPLDETAQGGREHPNGGGVGRSSRLLLAQLGDSQRALASGDLVVQDPTRYYPRGVSGGKGSSSRVTFQLEGQLEGAQHDLFDYAKAGAQHHHQDEMPELEASARDPSRRAVSLDEAMRQRGAMASRSFSVTAQVADNGMVIPSGRTQSHQSLLSHQSRFSSAAMQHDTGSAMPTDSGSHHASVTNSVRSSREAEMDWWRQAYDQAEQDEQSDTDSQAAAGGSFMT